VDKDNTPTVSVIIPTYNRAHLVSRAVRSVLDQTYQDFELVVVDDASTDNTEKVVKGFNDDRIRYFHHSENRGGSAARNTGIEAAKGEFIAFLDDDDEWLPPHLALTVETMERLSDDWGVVYTGYRVITRRKTARFCPKLKGQILKEILVEGSPAALPTFLIRRSCFDQVGLFDERFPRHQDVEMHIRLAKSYKYYPIHELSVQIYESPSPAVEKVQLAKKLLVDRFSEEIRSLGYIGKREFYSSYYVDLARLHFEQKDLREGFYWLAKGMIQYPFRVKQVLSAFRRAFVAVRDIVSAARWIC